MARCAFGITDATISRAGGISATQGELISLSKYTAPVRRTARNTSDKTSTFTSLPSAAGRAGIRLFQNSRFSET